MAFCAGCGGDTSLPCKLVSRNQKRDELFFVAPVIQWGWAALSRRAARGPRPDQARECRYRLSLRI